MPRLRLVIAGAVVVVAALSTGLPFLWFASYLGAIVVGGSWIAVRIGLTGLEAGYAVDRLSGHVGDRVRITYTVRNTVRLPKPWLEVHNPTELPGGLAGRVLALAGRSERTWVARSVLERRGHFRIDPLAIRTADPFGLFEATATVGHGITLVVYPRIDPLPHWRLPSAGLEGTSARPERTQQATPLATTIRPYAPGDAMHRIHWRSSARRDELLVKEFEIERTADVWVVVDMDAAWASGEGDRSSTEVAVRAAASIADRAVAEHRAVGLAVNGHRATLLPPDRGERQRVKILQLLAAVEADGVAPLAEALVATGGRLRRGMTAVVVTPSRDVTFVRPLAALRSRGISTLVVRVDAPGDRAAPVPAGGTAPGGGAERPVEAWREAVRPRRDPILHALAEHDIAFRVVGPDRSLAEALVR